MPENSDEREALLEKLEALKIGEKPSYTVHMIRNEAIDECIAVINEAAKTQAAPVCDATVSPDAATDWQKVMEALRGVIRVADRATVEFDAAKEALAICERNVGVESCPK